MSMVEALPRLSIDYLTRQPSVNLRKPPALFLLPGSSLSEADFLRLTADYDDRFLIVSLRPPLQLAGKNTWFNLERIGSLSFINAAQAEYSLEEMGKFLPEAVRVLKINPTQVYLMGYSQGAVIALNILLSDPALVAGAVLISVQAPAEIQSAAAPKEKLKGKSILQLHGLQDNIIPIAVGRAAGQMLSSLPLTHDTKFIARMGHLPDQECFDIVQKWLSKRLDEQGIFGLPDKPSYAAKISGMHLKVRDLDNAIRFYVRFLGMELIERTGKTYAFLSNNNSHHVIALQNIGSSAPLGLEDATGMYAARFEVGGQVEFAQAYKLLIDSGIKVSLIDHITCWEMHFQDPDGNGLELFWDTRDLPGKFHLWQGRDLPLNPQKVLDSLK